MIGLRSLLALAILSAATMAVSGTTMSNAEQNQEQDAKPVVTHTAVISTNMGDIEIELYGKDAPKTVLNFVGLANQGEYDGILFHRIVPGFVVQAGDPQTKDPSKQAMWGTGGTSIYDGNEFDDELNPDAPSSVRGYQPGTLAMANHGPNTNSSQFFICSGPRAVSLPHKYSIFGSVRSGMDVVAAMEKVDVNGNSVPVNPIRIEGIKTKELIKISGE